MTKIFTKVIGHLKASIAWLNNLPTVLQRLKCHFRELEPLEETNSTPTLSFMLLSIWGLGERKGGGVAGKTRC